MAAGRVALGLPLAPSLHASQPWVCRSSSLCEFRVSTVLTWWGGQEECQRSCLTWLDGKEGFASAPWAEEGNPESGGAGHGVAMQATRGTLAWLHERLRWEREVGQSPITAALKVKAGATSV